MFSALAREQAVPPGRARGASQPWVKLPLSPGNITRYDRPMTDQTNLEERIAHLTRTVDDLSDVVARQEKEITRLMRQVAALIEREAARGAEDSVTLTDQRPPHW